MASEKSKPLIRAVSLEKGQPIYKILIVDDHEDNRNLLFKLLKPFSFELSKAENGKEAVEIWKKCLPDLIWMDIKMPVMDGYEAVKIIRKSEKDNLSNKRCIIIAQTASVLEEDRNLILKAGCDDFMRKPFKETEIFEMMHKHLGIRFIYESIEKEKQSIQDQSTDISPEFFKGLPDELIESLEKASNKMDIDKVEILLKKIAETHSELAAGMSALASDFDYPKIVEMINNYRKNCYNTLL